MAISTNTKNNNDINYITVPDSDQVPNQTKFVEVPDLDSVIHPATKMEDPSLVINMHGSDIASFPLFTEDFCKFMINHSETVNQWTTARHKNYPTTDILLNDLGFKQFYDKVIEKYIVPIVKYIWRYEYENDTITSENFLAKYTPATQPGLATHTDSSLFSFVVSLNNEYEGGGTKFPRQNILIDSPVGYATIHPSRLTHPHGGMPITKGKRYIIVSFCEYKGYR